MSCYKRFRQDLVRLNSSELLIIEKFLSICFVISYEDTSLGVEPFGDVLLVIVADCLNVIGVID